MIRQTKESYDGLFYFEADYLQDFLTSSFGAPFEIIDTYDPVDRTYVVRKG